jgi:hypothetical protein
MLAHAIEQRKRHIVRPEPLILLSTIRINIELGSLTRLAAWE